MGSEYDTVADAIKATLAANTWIGDTDNIKVIEVEYQDLDEVEDRYKKGFKDDELPALLILVNEEDTDIKTATVRMLNYWMPFVIYFISARCTTETQARAAADVIIENVEGEMRDQNDAAKQLGIGDLVHEVKSTWKPVRAKNGIYAHGMIGGKVQHKVTL